MVHKRQVGPGDVVRPAPGGAEQFAGHQQIRDQVKGASGPGLGHQGQALLRLLHDPEGTGHRLIQGRGHLVWVALGSGPGELEIGLDILGLQPTADGWKRFTVNPNLGDLKWACATVPTPQGDLEVEAEGSRVTLRVPKDTTAAYGGRVFSGPCSVNVEIP